MGVHHIYNCHLKVYICTVIVLESHAAFVISIRIVVPVAGQIKTADCALTLPAEQGED